MGSDLQGSKDELQRSLENNWEVGAFGDFGKIEGLNIKERK